MNDSSTRPRREFLKMGAVGLAAPVGAARIAGASDVEVCVAFESGEASEHTHTETSDVMPQGVREQKIGEITGTGEPVGIEGEYVSDVYLTEPDRFDYSFWRGVATIGPHSDERGRIWLSDRFLTETARLLAHERGHNLGFRHTGGFMLPSNPDMEPDAELADESIETVVNTEGLYLCDWAGDNSTDALRGLIDDWRSDSISTDDLRYAIDRWRGNDARDIYADDTFATGLDGLTEYDDETRELRAEAVYRPENSDRYEPWERR